MITAGPVQTTTENVSRESPFCVEPFYTLKEASTLLNLKPWHLYRMSKRGELKLYFAGNKRARVTLSETIEAIRRYSELDPGEGGLQ